MRGSSRQLSAKTRTRGTSTCAPACRCKNHRQRDPGQDHGRTADRSGEGKNALAREDMHRELGGKQDRACLHHEADDKKRPRGGSCNPSVRGDRERSGRVQQEKQRAPLCELAAVRVDARGRQRYASRAHKRGDASENKGRAGHLWLHRRRGRSARGKQSLGPALVKAVRTIDPSDCTRVSRIGTSGESSNCRISECVTLSERIVRDGSRCGAPILFFIALSGATRSPTPPSPAFS